DYLEQATLKKAKDLGLSYINIAKTPINPDLLKILKPTTARKAMMMPFFRIGKRLRVAVVDPDNSETKRVLKELKKNKYLVNVNLASEAGMQEVLKLYDSDQYNVKKGLKTTYKEKDVQAYEKELVELSELKDKVESVTSEEGLQYINMGAMKTGASDIHFEPDAKRVRVRFRIDGVLHKVFELDPGTYKNLANQIKYLAKMKLNVTNIPQDGRFSFDLNKRKIDVRVSDIPTQFGESFVFRLLDSEKGLLSYEEMGFKHNYLKKMQQLTKMSHGMILCTGPTGAGKTSTLYTTLDTFNSPESKIITLEDPIEYNLPGISQSQINEKRGYNFADGLKSVLRQDPDVVMIGEIRDIETAETAAQAALTGHVVLSTLHTNSAVETIPRLINMGLPPFMVAPSLNTIIAQRLVRRVCDHCKVMHSIPEAKLKDIEKTVEAINKVRPDLDIKIPDKLPQPAGCDKCSHTGYSGRIAIHEVINFDYEIRDMILKEESSNNILLAARRKGLLTMREDGILKVLEGITTLEEVFRVTGVNK
ncbi:type II secretion system protein GspE, partial [Candidatus Peregrinibacteria bacterium]|nr:type II secretion system protein GspE [Candidatus Peregrinibacteria bacterium]